MTESRYQLMLKRRGRDDYAESGTILVAAGTEPRTEITVATPEGRVRVSIERLDEVAKTVYAEELR